MFLSRAADEEEEVESENPRKGFLVEEKGVDFGEKEMSEMEEVEQWSAISTFQLLRYRA